MQSIESIPTENNQTYDLLSVDYEHGAQILTSRQGKWQEARQESSTIRRR